MAVLTFRGPYEENGMSPLPRAGTSRRFTNNVIIREIAESDRSDWVRMREALWPGSPADHDEETRTFFEKRLETPVVFVAESKDRDCRLTLSRRRRRTSIYE